MRFDQELSEHEIAEFFGVTESRISQIIGRKIKPAVEAAVVLAEVADLYRDDPDYSMLVVRWIRL